MGLFGHGYTLDPSWAQVKVKKLQEFRLVRQFSGHFNLTEKFRIRDEGAERQKAGDKQPDGGFDRPFVVRLAEYCEAYISHPENAVGHTDDTHCFGLAPDIFERHRDTEEQQVGNRFPAADRAQPVESRVEFQKHMESMTAQLVPIKHSQTNGASL